MRDYAEDMPQTATYWPPGGNDGFGTVAIGAPETVAVRWQQRAELFMDAQGRQSVSAAVVYPAQPLEIGGWLFLGSSVASDPRDVTGAREIKQVGDSPDLEGVERLNKAWL